MRCLETVQESQHKCAFMLMNEDSAGQVLQPPQYYGPSEQNTSYIDSIKRESTGARK
jgi:hypothetical protein